MTVPVEREEVRIEREPVTGDVGGRIGDDEDISVTLHAERAVAVHFRGRPEQHVDGRAVRGVHGLEA